MVSPPLPLNTHLTFGRKVKEILDNTRLLAVCLNSHKLGQRKNCNLPGVVSDLPVLGPKDIDDVKNFAAKHGMDYVFASFVQCAEDVRMIRKVSMCGGVLLLRRRRRRRSRRRTTCRRTLRATMRKTAEACRTPRTRRAAPRCPRLQERSSMQQHA